MSKKHDDPVNTGIVLDRAERDRLRIVAAIRGLTMGDLIRQGVNHVLTTDQTQTVQYVQKLTPNQ